MRFRVTGLPAAQFRPLFALSEPELAERGARIVVSDGSGFPCRVGLVDACAGVRLLLLPHVHQPAASPYRASGPIFVGESSTETFDRTDFVPESLRQRLLSLRAYDDADCIVDGEVVEGREMDPVLERLLADPATAYVHAHYARHGCYACRIDRAPSATPVAGWTGPSRPRRRSREPAPGV